ncbi:DUF7146 domain-containing protein [Sphingopyxis sp.]|jgi:hypothetical protein|uniref:DUF7146 domain-containing protein n=1 Tax=Sphingopyxis sp. TaxID=1908224 RepID=UPI002DF57474|nr:toprim domain-containing protein [Sphingopyxis sp.]
METVSDIARRLADNAEAVCRRYLSNGRREGRYWLVGDVRNAPGRSLYVRLSGSGDASGQPGKWTDAESGEHGDLLDVIAASCGHANLRDTLAEARRFLSLPATDNAEPANPKPRKAPGGTPAAARRLWAAAHPTAGTLAASYLAGRGIHRAGNDPALRFHPSCYYRASRDDVPGVRSTYPAMIASVTNDHGAVVGVHRTWLDPAGGKADVAYPRRAMGQLLGYGVRFEAAAEVMAAGEGVETILSLREILPAMPMIAGLSAAHLAAIRFPETLRRLYVACDRDAAGKGALATLRERAVELHIEVVPLIPAHDDFNSDLCAMGRDAFAGRAAGLLRHEDVGRFLKS